MAQRAGRAAARGPVGSNTITPVSSVARDRIRQNSSSLARQEMAADFTLTDPVAKGPPADLTLPTASSLLPAFLLEGFFFRVMSPP